MAQLLERSLLTPEIRGSNPIIGKILSTNCTIEKTKIKKKRPGMAHLKKRVIVHSLIIDGHFKFDTANSIIVQPTDMRVPAP